MSTVRLRISADGSVHGLYDDAVDWQALGPVIVRRASHVEFCPRKQAWYVQLARPASWWRRLVQVMTGCRCGEIICWSASRTSALEWEHEHLAPGELRP